MLLSKTPFIHNMCVFPTALVLAWLWIHNCGEATAYEIHRCCLGRQPKYISTNPETPPGFWKTGWDSSLIIMEVSPPWLFFFFSSTTCIFLSHRTHCSILMLYHPSWRSLSDKWEQQPTANLLTPGILTGFYGDRLHINCTHHLSLSDVWDSVGTVEINDGRSKPENKLIHTQRSHRSCLSSSGCQSPRSSCISAGTEPLNMLMLDGGKERGEKGIQRGTITTRFI